MKIKKILIVLLTAVFCTTSINAAVNKYKVFKKAKYVGTMTSYEVDDNIYFDLNDITKHLNAKKNIYSVSKKIVLSIGNKKLNISKDMVDFDGISTANIPSAFILRGSKYFLNSDIFLSPTFAKVFELKLDFDDKSRTIKIYDDINITSVKNFSYTEKTRIVVYMTKKLDYKLDTVGKTLVLTVFDGSYVLQNDIIDINDGNVENIKMTQDPNLFKLVIEMGDNFDGYESSTLKDPDRIVIDIKSKAPTVENRISGVISPSTPDMSGSSSSFVLPDKLKPNGDEKTVVVIDAGHGGKDPGGRAVSGKKEKQINLEIAKKLYDILKKDDKFEVILTRSSDYFIPLYERSKIANDAKCDLFISIHANAHKDKNVNGYEIYFLSEKASDPWANEVADYENASINYEEGTFDYGGAAMVLHSMARNEYINEGSKLAAYVSRYMSKDTPFNNNGIKQAAFYVLRGTYAPGILVEVGFMSNKKDKKNLDNPSVQEKVARSIYKGILDYEDQNK